MLRKLLNSCIVFLVGKEIKILGLSPHLTDTSCVTSRDRGSDAYSMVSGIKWVLGT